ncbi:hypothetical protein [uncultured Tateyamaria sp.]|uniref:hypothetical protein n=1 Tax=uncultured Tateyamaria sp. TaxID=455651 RepID=UPI00262B1EFD|nr:hypothetical protein [uncultured Tateyamaria sp.]
MKDYLKPTTWNDPSVKLFPYQVAFTCPPNDFDPSPSDFLRISPRSVGVHARMLFNRDYGHELSQRKAMFGQLEEYVECMANTGADVCGQIGSNWVHASGLGVDGVRQYCDEISDRYETPFHMAGYCMVEALRDMNVEKVALNASYHWPEWWQGTVGFLKEAGFDVVWAGNFVDQGWFDVQDDLNDCIWCFDGELAKKSFEYVADKAPNADAYLANGLPNFRRASDGLAERLVDLEVGLEQALGKPIVSHDSALYWRIFKTLGIGPATEQGALLSSLKS